MPEIKITVSPDANHELIKEVAERHDIYAKYLGHGVYKLSSDDPENFFWFGCNFPKNKQP